MFSKLFWVNSSGVFHLCNWITFRPSLFMENKNTDPWYFISHSYNYNYKELNIEMKKWTHMNNKVFMIILQERSAVITTYAICGFSSLGTLAMLIPMWGTVSKRSSEHLTSMLIRIYINSNFACFLTACVAGMNLLIWTCVLREISLSIMQHGPGRQPYAGNSTDNTSNSCAFTTLKGDGDREE